MIELRTDQSVTFSWYDPAGLVPASVTAQLVDRKGGVLATGSVTLPTASTTVHGQHAAYFDVVDSAGIILVCILRSLVTPSPMFERSCG